MVRPVRVCGVVGRLDGGEGDIIVDFVGVVSVQDVRTGYVSCFFFLLFPELK